VYAAAIAEVPALFGVPVSALFRYDTDRSVTVVGASADRAHHLGRRWTFPADEPTVIATVLRTGQPSQLDRDGRLGRGADGQPPRQFGIDAALGMPIVVNGRVWGVFTMGAADDALDLPPDAVDRLRPFTDLLGTATGNTEAWSEVRRLVDEQTALRRVATLVARGAGPRDVFTTVADELGRVLEVDVACVVRYEPDATATVVAAYGDDAPWPVGSTLPLDGAGIAEQVFRARRPLRSDGFEGAPGALATVVREGHNAPGAGAPIMIGDRLWGAAVATSASAALPTAAERRLGSFADLIATAITNAETRAELNASRARVVAASDETRRKLEQDLHDGIQQRLVTLAIRARVTSAATSDVPPEVRKELSQLSDDLVVALDELRETARGIHPAILTEAGLGPALKALARRSTVPVRLDVTLGSRLDQALEVAVYYVASEALTNAVKHARATVIDVSLNCRNGTACLSVRDDGIGGVDPTGGFGLLGLKDRVEALAGHLTILSPPGKGTTVVARLPTTVDAALAVGRLS
jgi:signal transduction histidine kinase